MENFHSTKDVSIERNTTFGTRIVIKNVKNSNTKNGKFATVVSSDLQISKGDVLRAFFDKLDKGEVKNQQGAVLHCDKKDSYWFDVSDQFPRGISSDPSMTRDGMTYLKFKTYRYLDGVKQQGSTYYRGAWFEDKVFPSDAVTVQAKAKYLKGHLNEVLTSDGKRIVEYVADCFDKIPALDVPCGPKYPKYIEILSICSERREVKAQISCGANGRKTHTFIINEEVPMNLYKPLYSYFIADMISKGVAVTGGRIRYDRDTCQYVFVANEDLKVDDNDQPMPAPSSVKSSNIIVDPRSDEAKALLHKRVYASNGYNMNNKFTGVLESIDADSDFPFVVDDKKVMFIKEASQPKLECYDFSMSDVRRNLLGKIFVSKSGDREEMLVSFRIVNDRWVVNDKITAYDLMTKYLWADGSECGVIRVADEMPENIENKIEE